MVCSGLLSANALLARRRGRLDRIHDPAASDRLGSPVPSRREQARRRFRSGSTAAAAVLSRIDRRLRVESRSSGGQGWRERRRWLPHARVERLTLYTVSVAEYIHHFRRPFFFTHCDFDRSMQASLCRSRLSQPGAAPPADRVEAGSLSTPASHTAMAAPSRRMRVLITNDDGPRPAPAATRRSSTRSPAP